MLFELIKLGGFYITLAYNGPCSELNGEVLPYAAENAIYHTAESAIYHATQRNVHKNNWCIIEYQVIIDGDFEPILDEKFMMTFITQSTPSVPRSDLFGIHRWYYPPKTLRYPVCGTTFGQCN